VGNDIDDYTDMEGNECKKVEADQRDAVEQEEVGNDLEYDDDFGVEDD
jgi:hypothetical protein